MAGKKERLDVLLVETLLLKHYIILTITMLEWI